jgi:hypothetical protein
MVVASLAVSLPPDVVVLLAAVLAALHLTLHRRWWQVTVGRRRTKG